MAGDRIPRLRYEMFRESDTHDTNAPKKIAEAPLRASASLLFAYQRYMLKLSR